MPFLILPAALLVCVMMVAPMVGARCSYHLPHAMWQVGSPLRS